MRSNICVPQLQQRVARIGAAAKAVSRQNEFAQKTHQLGETAYETFDYSQDKKARRSRTSYSRPEGFFSSSVPSVSHAAGVETRASGMAEQTFRLFLEPQVDPFGPDAHDLGQGRLRSGAFPQAARRGSAEPSRFTTLDAERRIGNR